MAAASASLAAPEPVHEGKSLSEWAAMMNRNPGHHGATQALGEMGDAALPHLVEALRTHPDGAIRYLCHLALTKIGRQALPDLDRIMEDGDRGARIQAVLAYEKILGQEAIPSLRKALQDADPAVKARAHGALVRLGLPADEHLPAMNAILLDGDAGARWIAAESLGWCGSRADGAVPSLATAVDKGPPAVAARALRALEEIGTQTAMAHVCRHRARKLADPDLTLAVRIGDAAALGKAGATAEGALADLRKLQADREQDILLRGYAAWAAQMIDTRPGPRTAAIYHVAIEHPSADDANPGTGERPWRTVQRAAELLRPGDTALIHSGTYRETVRPFLGGTGPEHMITYAAAPGEAPVLKGSDTWRPEWRHEGGPLWSAPYQRHPWDHPETWTNPKTGPMHRAEQIFVDGTQLVHVATDGELRQTPGTFLTDDAQQRLWVHAEEAPPLASRLVERSMRQQVFAPAVRGLGYIRVKGLTMRHAAAPESNGANWGIIGHRAVLSVRAGHHWVIEDNVIEWGNAQGLDVGGEGWSAHLRDEPIVAAERGGHVVRRNRVNHHGVAGIVGWGGGEVGLLLEDNETSFNCLKGNLYQYEAAGVKLHNAEDCTIRRHRSHRNNAFGIWLDHRCLRNRITQSVCTENTAAGIFFEVSAGPLLVDNNVIIGTRDAPRGGWGEGIYSHDGNQATYIHNYIAGCAGFGVRLRNLFGRVADGKPTTTSHNRVLNNVILDCDRGAISLNPDVPRAEDNLSDHNLLWQSGKPIRMQLEHAGTGVHWEDTDVGRAVGRSGVGDLALELPHWRTAAARDQHSLPLPGDLLFADTRPDDVAAALVRTWPASAPSLAAGYGKVTPLPAGTLLAALRPSWPSPELVRTIRLSPDAGLQVWRHSGGTTTVRWQAGRSTHVEPLTHPFLVRPPSPEALAPVSVAAGDRVRCSTPWSPTTLLSVLPVQRQDDRVTVLPTPETAAGRYGVVVAAEDRWTTIPVDVETPFALEGVTADRRDGENCVVLGIRSRRSTPARGEVTVKAGTARATVTVDVLPQATTTVRLPLPTDGAVSVEVGVDLPGAQLHATEVLSFAYAARDTDWPAAQAYAVDEFPGGAFPEGAEAFALFQGGFAAEWKARYDDRGLRLLVDVRDPNHTQTGTPDALWKQDSIQLLLRAHADRTPLELDVALPAPSGRPVVFRRLSPRSDAPPAGETTDVQAAVSRQGNGTHYTVTVPWEELGLEQAPRAGTRLDFSLLVNNDDGAGRHGLQWFFGIHGHRGEYERMGSLWLQ